MNSTGAITDQFLPALLWMLLHSLWQGFILTALAALVILFTRRSTPALRYVLLSLLFFSFLAGAAISFLLAFHPAGEMVGGPFSLTATGTSNGASILTSQWLPALLDLVTTYRSPILMAWMIILMVKAVRLVCSIYGMNRLRHHATIPIASEWNSRLQQLNITIGLTRPVVLLESALISVPVVMGYFKPLILVPVGFMNQLTIAEAEAVLLHELAHIKRHDYVVNFLQHLAEVVFFFNPGLLWVSGLMRKEREHCCDDLALQHRTGKSAYVELLIRCREQAMEKSLPVPGFAAHGSELVRRVARIVFQKNSTLGKWETAFLILNIVALVVWITGKMPEPLVYVNSSEVMMQSIRLPESKPLMPVSKGSTKYSIPAPLVVVPKREKVRVVKKKNALSAEVRKPVAASIQVRLDYDKVLPIYKADQPSSLSYQEQAEKDREQAKIDRIQAEKDRAQAELDRAQAERDRQQAMKDREVAERDRIQAQKDRQQADLDRLQAQQGTRIKVTKSILQ